MMNVLYVLIAVLIFGLLILIHEGGHFLFARLFGVTVREFSIGMGPAILSRTSKKNDIKYSLRLIPFGGYVSMVGEDEDSDDPNAFHKKKVWQRIVVTAAGAAMNILSGVLVMAILIASASSLASTVVHSFREEAVSVTAGLQENDRILKVDGVRVHTGDELVYEVMRRGVEPIDLTVLRAGKTLVLSDVTFPIMKESGTTFGTLDFYVYSEEKTVGSVFTHVVSRSWSTIKMVWESLFDLLTGRYGIESVSGPVGVNQVMTDAAKSGVADVAYLAVVISMNLGVMNLLPLPALDGGRLIFLIIEGIRRKPLSRKVEGYIHFAGFVILMILMAVIMVKDVIGLFL